MAVSLGSYLYADLIPQLFGNEYHIYAVFLPLLGGNKEVAAYCIAFAAVGHAAVDSHANAFFGALCIAAEPYAVCRGGNFFNAPYGIVKAMYYFIIPYQHYDFFRAVCYHRNAV